MTQFFQYKKNHELKTLRFSLILSNFNVLTNFTFTNFVNVKKKFSPERIIKKFGRLLLVKDNFLYNQKLVREIFLLRVKKIEKGI